MRKIVFVLAAAAALAFDDLTPAQIAEFEAECENGDLQVCGGLGEGYESGELGFAKDHARA